MPGTARGYAGTGERTCYNRVTRVVLVRCCETERISSAMGGWVYVCLTERGKAISERKGNAGRFYLTNRVTDDDTRIGRLGGDRLKFWLAGARLMHTRFFNLICALAVPYRDV